MPYIMDGDYICHEGVEFRSGRYPYGSGKNPNQHGGDLLTRIETLKKTGWAESAENVKELFGMSLVEYRKEKSRVLFERDNTRIVAIQNLRDNGYSWRALAKELNMSESTARSLMSESASKRVDSAKSTADFIREEISKKGMIDIGTGVERELGISRNKLDQALSILEEEGYPIYGGRIDQVTNPGKKTTLKVIGSKETEHKDIFNTENVHSLKDYKSFDDGETFKKKYTYPTSLDSKRLQIRYAEDGGINKDGVIELRRGVEDISLGKSTYAQVRILVDDNLYLKGMAVYSDNLPPGVDVLFNTNKTKDQPMNKVLKDAKKNLAKDPENPFGALIKEDGQRWYTDPKTGKETLSLINKRADEGDWNDWSDTLPSQFLAKQNIKLINRQLGLATDKKQAEFDEIMALTNPTVKKVLLESYADDCDASSVHLKAASLPGQKYQVILPLTSISDKEVYAPNFEEGTQVALVRYPHGGTFEIPILTVNNKNKEAVGVLGKSPLDAVGINSKVAERLSGADFDGDTVMAIPITKTTKITSTPALEELVGFDPKIQYPKVEGMKVMKDTQKQMGVISNLITDMTLHDATNSELARAVKHSMTVIDAEKHSLNYKLSEEENGISALKKKYQGHYDANGDYKEGAATLLSRAKGQITVQKTKGSGKIDPETGKKVYSVDTSTYIDPKTGKELHRAQRSTKMAEVDDAFELSSGTAKEAAYAAYANNLKQLANQARLAVLDTPKIKKSTAAAIAYKEEVDSLKDKLNTALLNAPRERQAQAIANAEVKAIKIDNPDITKADIKKLSQQALNKARISVGAEKEYVTITDKEWEAIQSGAISETTLYQILKNTDTSNVRQLATPKQSKEISTTTKNRIKTYKASGYATNEIAKLLGISVSTVQNY